MTSRIALVLCVFLLALPVLRLAELVTTQNAALLVGNGAVPEEDEQGGESVVKVVIPRATRHAVPQARLSAIESPPRPPGHAAPAGPGPASEQRCANGCGAVLRC